MDNNIIFEMSMSESLIMDFLWETDKGMTFSEISDYLNNELKKDWKKQTINTFIKRLTDKNLISAKRTGKNKIYYAALTKREYEKGHAQKLLDDFYNGSISKFLTALTGGKKIDREFADELRDIINKESL